jgi:hypothetical protein
MSRLGLLLLVVALAFGCSSKEPKREASGATGRTKSEIDAFSKRMRTLRERTPEPRDDLGDEPCPDEQLERATRGAPAPLLVADYDYLERFARPETNPHAGLGAAFRLLTTPALRAIVPAAQIANQSMGTDVLFNIKKLDEAYDYVAVIRTSERLLPRREGGKFHAGRLAGHLVVFELASGKALCRARVDAESSSEVAGIQGSDPERVLKNDFYAKIRDAIGGAVRRVSRILREELG